MRALRHARDGCWRPETPRRCSARRAVIALALAALAPGVAAAQPREMNSSLAGQLRLFQLRIVSGRASAVGPVSGQSMTSSATGADRRERLSINLAGGLPTVSYELAMSREDVSYEIVRGNQVTIRQTPKSQGGPTAVLFTQLDDGPLRLSVGNPPEVKTVYAASLWHLLLAEPELCRQRLVPLLQIMRPGWQIAQRAEEIEALLCRTSQARPSPDRHVWQQAVTDLASDRYHERQAAEARLLGAGQKVLPFLQAQPRRDLDAEQWFRVRRVIRQLSGDGDEDTPDRVAFWLLDDPRVWYSLLARDDAGTRRLAAAKLAQLLAQPIEFDAAAPPRAREAQRAALAARFGDAVLQPVPPAAPPAE